MVQEPVQLIPTGDDYQILLSNNPLAATQLQSIILTRLLAEKDAELTALKKETEDSEEAGDSDEPDNVTPISGAAGD